MSEACDSKRIIGFSLTIFCVLSLLRQGEMSQVMSKPAFCICENKGADQLRGNCAADLCLRFRYMDSTIPLKFQALTFFCGCTSRFVSKTPKTGVLATQFNSVLRQGEMSPVMRKPVLTEFPTTRGTT